MSATKLKSIAAAQQKLSVINYRTQSITTKIADGRHVAAGAIVTNQITANSLPSVDSVIRRRQAKAHRKNLFGSKHLYLVTSEPKNNTVAKNCIAA